MSRKHFVLSVLLILAWPMARAAAPAPSFFTLHDLGHGVWAAISPPDSPASSAILVCA